MGRHHPLGGNSDPGWKKPRFADIKNCPSKNKAKKLFIWDQAVMATRVDPVIFIQ